MCECQTVIFYDVSEQVLLERCLVRASNASVQREDDNEETLKNRLRNFKDLSRPVVDLYQQFGKVRYIDAGYSIADVYAETRKAMLPQVFFLIGPSCSGKSTLGHALAERSNMKLVKFTDFIREKHLKKSDDAVVVAELTRYLVVETASRVLIEDFPRTEAQARLFVKNCIEPTEVFYCRCSKDVCQERMTELGKNHPSYLPSALLSKKVRLFHQNAASLLPYLRGNTRFSEINTEQHVGMALKNMCEIVQPTVISVRGTDAGLQQEIVDKLSGNNGWGYVHLEIEKLIDLEN